MPRMFTSFCLSDSLLLPMLRDGQAFLKRLLAAIVSGRPGLPR